MQSKLQTEDGGCDWKEKCILCGDNCELGSYDLEEQKGETIVSACDHHGYEWQ